MKYIYRIIVILLFCHPLHAQKLISPKDHFGFAMGDDYHLANYDQMESYFLTVSEASDRIKVRTIGTTEEGRNQHLFIISSPENIKNIEKYRSISQKLARAEGLTDAQARQLSKEGKPVVWIDGGLHSNEMVGSHQLVETFYQLASRNDEEMLNYLDKVIVLMWHANPDGQQLLANWYMQEKDPGKRNMRIPYLYQKYIGHDNNRDFFMMNMKETENISRVLYVDWIPQIVYNHHQASPAGTIVAGPPYRDPFNYVFDPMLITSLDGVGAAMINRLNQEDKPGYTRLSGSVYSTWWNGGLRTTPYFHNMIGILTEIAGNPTPMKIPLVPDRLLPNNATPYPVVPQDWHFKQSIDYSLSLNYAVLDYAARNGDALLYNIYKMGANSIRRGSEDHWTFYPKYVDTIVNDYWSDSGEANKVPLHSLRKSSIPDDYLTKVVGDPDKRDARGYIIPANQDDFPTAVKFVNALIKSGINVHRAKEAFSALNHSYPAGSYLIKTNQAFRPHVLDMFEPQNHPHDTQYEGGPPVRPYDAAGWTLAIQMGVEFDRVYEDVDGAFESIPYGELQSVSLSKGFEEGQYGYLMSAKQNDSFSLVNELLKQGVRIDRISEAVADFPKGSFYVDEKYRKNLTELSEKYAVSIYSATMVPVNRIEIQPARIALFDYYGGSIPSGWVRWILEQFNFEYQLVYPQDIDKGELRQKYDVIAFIGPGVPNVGVKENPIMKNQPKEQDIAQVYHHLLGALSVDRSIPQLKEYLINGGNIITVGASTKLLYHFNLPVKNAMVKIAEDGKELPLSAVDYFIPTSIVHLKINNDNACAWGMPGAVGAVFNNSPVFKILPEGRNQVTPLAEFVSDEPVMSGWAHGQSYLKDGVAALEAKVGKGKLYAFGPEITNRGQAHATFKLLFNVLYTMKD